MGGVGKRGHVYLDELQFVVVKQQSWNLDMQLGIYLSP